MFNSSKYAIATQAHSGPAGDVPALIRQVLDELREVRDLLEARRKPLLTVEEVAREVGRDPYTVRTWIKAGKLPATRVEGTGPKGRLLVRREDLDRLVGHGLAVPPTHSTDALPGDRT